MGEALMQAPGAMRFFHYRQSLGDYNPPDGGRTSRQVE
jgi:hypothetical protein